MNKIFFGIFFFIGLPVIAFTQSFSDVDSLKSELANAKEDTTRALLFGKLSYAYIFAYPDTAYLYAERGLHLSRKISYKRAEIICLKWLGGVFETRGNFPKAIELGLQALKLAESIHDKKEMGRCFSALSYFYDDIGEYRKSLDYSILCIEYARDLNDDVLEAVGLFNCGNSYEKLNMLDSALIYQQQAYSLALQQQDEQLIGGAFTNLGNIYSKMNASDLAFANYRHSIPYSVKLNDFAGLNEIYLGMAKLFLDTAKDSAAVYANYALNSANEGKFNSGKLKASKFLADLYRTENQTDSAYKYLALTVGFKDSIFNEEKVKQVQNLTFHEMVRQQELAEAKAKAEQERSTHLQLIGIAIFIITFSLFVILMSRRKLKPRTIEFIGLLALLLMFEFISLLIHPFIGNWTHHSPVLMLAILVAVAAILAPIHHGLQRWVKEKLVHKVHLPE